MFVILQQKLRAFLNIGLKSANLSCNSLQISLLLLFRYFGSTTFMDDYIRYLLNQLSENDLYQVIRRELQVLKAKDYTLLHVAAWSRQENIQIVLHLIEHGVDVNSTTLHGHTPLHFAVAARKRRTVHTLIEADASVNAKDNVGRRALHFAVVTRWWYPPTPYSYYPCDMLIVKTLLDNPKIDVNPVDNVGNTPLMWAVTEQNCHAVKILLKKGANPNISNCNNQTPLHKALSFRNLNHDIVFALLENGADIYSEDKFQQTPVGILVRNIRTGEPLWFAKRVMWLIALRYHIRDSLRQTLEKIPELHQYLETCCNEVTLMGAHSIYENFTLHDFANDCFQATGVDPVLYVYKPVVKILLSGSFVQYLQFILERMTRKELHSVLERCVPEFIHGPLHPHLSHLTIFYKIRFHCNGIL